jgi:hypothetical protein
MDKITFVDVQNPYTQEMITNVVITHDDGSITGMLKSTYDAMQANSTLVSNSSIPQAGN